VIYVGLVEAVETSEREPMLFLRGRYRRPAAESNG
jgi:hypothetical protein